MNRQAASSRTRAEIRALIQAAERTLATTGQTGERQVAALVALSRDAVDPQHDPAELVIDDVMTMVRNAYEGGWQPSDLVHVARWRGSRAAGPWIGHAILAEAERADAFTRAPRRWTEQLEQIDRVGPLAIDGPDGWEAALSTLVMLHSLPTVEVIAPTPSMWDSPEVRIDLRVDSNRPEDKMLARVRSLLAKAESTEYPAEAEAFTAKAQDLMTRHAIDEALVRAEHHTSTRVAAIRVILEPPYTKEKAVILHVVAKANHSRAVWNDWANFVTLIGVEDDIDHVEMLFTSLLVQATRAMISQGEEAGARARSIGYRKSFLNGYAVRLGDRLAEAAQEAEESYGGSLLPVLAAQDEAVRNEVERLFPRLRRSDRGASSFDARGWTAGQQAADAAVLPTGQLGTSEA